MFGFPLGNPLRLNARMLYTCQLSHLRVENCNLTPALACRPISHAWLKNVSCCCLAWHNFQKYVNSDPRKERKPCVKWINDDTFLVKSTGSGLAFIRVLRLGLGNARAVFAFVTVFKFGRLRTSSEDFGRLRKTSDFFGNLRKWSCRLQESQHSQDKNLTPISQKKLAGIMLRCWSLSVQ